LLLSFAKFPVQFGDYLLAYRVASGGMADIYCAKPTATADLKRLVAIKCMRPSLSEDEKFSSMFVDEAKLATTLTHANIVQILDLGRVGGQLFIAMELVHGRDLGSMIKRARDLAIELPLGVCAYIIAKAAEALDFAHHLTSLEGEPLDIVHSDVSPQNILVSFDGAVKVVDFGIARAGGRDSGLEGKFAYMAPEQTRAGDVDKRVDVFALGSVLFELITGARLFEAESQFGVLEKVRVAELPDLEATDSRIRGDVASVLRRALARDPDERFSQAMELAEALSPLMIDGTTIVGARQTAELMRSLFEEEIERDAERMKRAIDLSLDDVGEATAVAQAPAAGEPEILAGSLDVQAAGAAPQSDLDDIDVDIMPIEEKRDASAVTPATGWPVATKETTAAEEQERTRPAAEVLGRPVGDLLGGRTVSEGEPDAAGLPRDTLPQAGPLGLPRDTVLESPVSAELPRDTVLESLAPAELPRDTVLESPASGELLREPLPHRLPGAGAVPEETADEPRGPEAATGVGLPPPASSRAGVVAGGLAGLALVAAVLGLVVWPRVEPHSSGEPNAVPASSPAARQAVTDDGPEAAEAVASEDSEGPDEDPAAPSGEASSDGGVTSAEPEVEDDNEAGATGKRRFGFIRVKTPGVKAARIFVDGREVTRAAKRGLKVRTGKRTITVIEQVNGRHGRTKIKNVRVGSGTTRDSPLKVVVRL
jgi:hypothetical protein